MGEEVPKKGKAAVVVNEGPEFRVEIQDVDVPEPSTLDIEAVSWSAIRRPC